jgi:hypothetical protein
MSQLLGGMEISRPVSSSTNTGESFLAVQTAPRLHAVTVFRPDLPVDPPTVDVLALARLEVWVKDGEMLSPPSSGRLRSTTSSSKPNPSGFKQC